MIEVILDTETTGLSVKEKHRIIEIGCIELKNQIPTGKIFHEYLNPERKVSEEAFKVHGYSDDFLSAQKKFPEIAVNFFNFIKDKKIVIHNAIFDLSFLDFDKISNCCCSTAAFPTNNCMCFFILLTAAQIVGITS